MTQNASSEPNNLLLNLSKLHTTAMGAERIKRNLSLDTDDAVRWCRDLILAPGSAITQNGKNWYVETDRCVITVNASSFTIITAHTSSRSSRPKS